MDEMGLISPDGKWWWDGRQWVPMQQTRPSAPEAESSVPAGHSVIPVYRKVPVKYWPDLEPPEFKARFGSILLLMGFVLTLPAMGAGTIFSMAVATGQSPAWPTIGEGIVIFGIVLAFLGSWPLIGLLLGFGIRDGIRWVLVCLASSGAVPALGLGGLMAVGAPTAGASDMVTMEVALAWMWALPALGLLLLRTMHVGRPLPRLRTFAGMFGSGWRGRLPGPQTQAAELTSSVRYPLRVPGADFALPPEAMDAVYGSRGPVLVTYDLQQGRVETIEVGM